MEKTKNEKIGRIHSTVSQKVNRNHGNRSNCQVVGLWQLFFELPGWTSLRKVKSHYIRRGGCKIVFNIVLYVFDRNKTFFFGGWHYCSSACLLLSPYLLYLIRNYPLAVHPRQLTVLISIKQYVPHCHYCPEDTFCDEDQGQGVSHKD